MPDLTVFLIPSWFVALLAILSVWYWVERWRARRWVPFWILFLREIVPPLYIAVLYLSIFLWNIPPQGLSVYARFGITLLLLPTAIETVMSIIRFLKRKRT